MLGDVIARTSSSEHDDPITARKKFIIRLLLALYSAGNLSYRTDKYVHKVSSAFGLYTSLTLLSNRAIVSFQQPDALGPMSSESYAFTTKPGWFYAKLIKLDQLCFDIVKRDLPFEKACLNLAQIDSMPDPYVTRIIFPPLITFVLVTPGMSPWLLSVWLLFVRQQLSSGVL
jgi:uncharacterized membrane protein YjjP (DUF1212 family)